MELENKRKVKKMRRALERSRKAGRINRFTLNVEEWGFSFVTYKIINGKEESFNWGGIGSWCQFDSCYKYHKEWLYY